MRGMTGYGHSKMRIGNVALSVEIRSTNHRFLEIVLHLPDGFLRLESSLRGLIEKKLKRGRIVASVNVAGGTQKKIVINRGLIRDYAREIKSLQKDIGMCIALDANALLSLPGALNIYDIDEDKNRLSSAIIKLTNEALGALIEMRCREGQALQSDLRLRINRIARIEKLIKMHFRKALNRRLKKLRTPEEKSSFIKNSDITEELVRINYHIRNFNRLLNKPDTYGKELDFIAQEIQRETNTTGAKSIDAFVSSGVVKMKSEIEKIREQLQNIE